MDDSIGEETAVNYDFCIDYPRRDAPIVYLDGEVIVGTHNDSHMSALNNWCEENGIDWEGSTWGRESADDVSQMLDKEKVAFGHIENGMAFIDTLMSCTESEVTKAIAKIKSFSKIYFWNRDDNSVTRLARKNNTIKMLQRFSVFKRNMGL